MESPAGPPTVLGLPPVLVRAGITASIGLLLAGAAPPPSAGQEKDPPETVLHPCGFGWALSGPGDLDGDGTPDIVAGAPGTKVRGRETGSILGAGMVLACSGATGRVLWAVPGTEEEERFGEVLCRVGDLDSDGTPDVLVGVPASSSGTGAVRILSGVDGKVLREVPGVGPGERFGHSVSEAGDVDGDGCSDLLVGRMPPDAPLKAGPLTVATVLSGKTGAEVHSIQVPRSAMGSGGRREEAHAVAVAGGWDFSKDGQPDFVVGCPHATTVRGWGVGQVLLFTRKRDRPVTVMDGEPVRNAAKRIREWARFGAAVAVGGDVNRDGVADILVGSPRAYPATRGWDLEDPGMVSVRSGATGKRLFDVEGFLPYDGFGLQVAWVGDVNGDKGDDFIVGAPLVNLAKDPEKEILWVGRAAVHSGRQGTRIHVWEGSPRNGRFGTAVAAAGDLDGDGVPDVLVGEPDGLAGEVHAYSGKSGAQILCLRAWDLVEEVRERVGKGK